MLRTCRPFSSFAAACALCCVLVGQDLFAATTYDIKTLGFTDSEYTRSDGRRDSDVYAANASGQVIGWSERYNGEDDEGQSAWFYGHGALARMGLTDADHTRSDGQQVSVATLLNAAGQCIGSSNSYNGSAPTGQSAWLYDHGATIRLGYFGAGYTGSGDVQYSHAQCLNDSGQVAGISYTYDGSANLGAAAWLYDHGTTTRIGFTDADYTGSTGYQYSSPSDINAAGQVVGLSVRFTGGGNSAWLYDHGTTTRLGLIDAAYPNNDSSEATRINAAGQVVGNTEYAISGSAYYGAAAWLYDRGTTTRLGLTDAEHTRDDGYKSSQATQLNEAGNVVGFSYRYGSGSNDIKGVSAWLYKDGVTARLGLIDSEHTRSDGYQTSQLTSGSGQTLNRAGQVIGYSARYADMADAGRSAWVYANGVTTRLGLVDAAHTRTDGYAYSEAKSINEEGQVIGVSSRFGSIGNLGQSGWFFDDVLNQTFTLEFSTRPGGYSYTNPLYLADDGSVLGSYELFNASGSDLGARAFLWSVSDGFSDLGVLVDGGLTVNGWKSLYTASLINGQGEIVGRGNPLSYPGGNVAFLMTPAPEPATSILLLVGAMSFAIGFRRYGTRFDRQ
jgi:hypothetical protein